MEMIISNDLNKKHFLKPLESEELEKFFKNFSAKSLTSHKIYFSIWKQGAGPDKVKTFKVLYAANTNYRVIYLRPTKKEESDSMIHPNHETKEVLFKVIIADEQYFSDCTITYDEKRDASFIIIDRTIYKGVQRSAERLVADKFNKISMKINEGVFKCLDISSRGTSFIVSGEINEEFPVETVFEKCQIKFNKEQYVIDQARIACNIDLNTKNPEGLSLFKIGIQFLQFDYRSEEMLGRQISKELKIVASKHELDNDDDDNNDDYDEEEFDETG